LTRDYAKRFKGSGMFVGVGKQLIVESSGVKRGACSVASAQVALMIRRIVINRRVYLPW